MSDDLANVCAMTAKRKLNQAIAAGCFLLLSLWLFFWLFIASRDSGQATTITQVNGHDHMDVRYDNARRYGPYLPLVVLGLYGGVAGSLASFCVRRKPHDQRLLVALVFSPLVAALSAMVIYGVLAFFTPNDFHPPDLRPIRRILPALGLMLLYSPGVFIFAGLPAALGGVATTCLFSGEHKLPIIPHTPPPLPKPDGL